MPVQLAAAENPLASESHQTSAGTIYLDNLATSAVDPRVLEAMLPFFSEFAYVRQLAESGDHGRLLAAHFRRVITPPDWSDDMSDFRNLGGWGVDLHIHDNHYIGLLCGTPASVVSRGLLQEGLVNHVHSQYIYDSPDGSSGPAVTCVSGGIAAAGLALAWYARHYQVRLRIDQSKMDTGYANAFRTSATAEEIMIDFGLNQVIQTGQGEQAEVITKINAVVVVYYYSAMIHLFEQ